jgi:hypothetical protein
VVKSLFDQVHYYNYSQMGHQEFEDLNVKWTTNRTLVEVARETIAFAKFLVGGEDTPSHHIENNEKTWCVIFFVLVDRS